MSTRPQDLPDAPPQSAVLTPSDLVCAVLGVPVLLVLLDRVALWVLS